MFVPAGYVKLEGATVDRSNYPRLVALADAYSLWTSDTTANPGLFGEGDGSTTMVLPNWTGRMAQFAATAGGKIDAGLPNITGFVKFYIAGIGAPGNGQDLPCKGSGSFETVGGLYSRDIVSLNGSNTGYHSNGMNFKASNSSPIYSASQTVQPPAINTFAIMRY